MYILILQNFINNKQSARSKIASNAAVRCDISSFYSVVFEVCSRRVNITKQTQLRADSS